MEKIVILNIALNYDGRDEILRAVGKIVKDGAAPVDEEGFKQYLDIAALPDPDLLIMAGEQVEGK